MHNKFKELKLKTGQDTILNKETADFFGLKEGHVIGFGGFQTFLKEIYDKENINNVEL